MVHNGFNCLPFYLSNSLKNQNFKKMKKTSGDIIILHKCTKNYDHMLCCPWDKVHDRCNYSFSFWVIFCPFTPRTPPLKAQKIKISKKWKNACRYNHFTYVYHKLWSDDVWFLRYGARQMDRRMEKVTYRGGCPT